MQRGGARSAEQEDAVRMTPAAPQPSTGRTPEAVVLPVESGPFLFSSAVASSCCVLAPHSVQLSPPSQPAAQTTQMGPPETHPRLWCIPLNPMALPGGHWGQLPLEQPGRMNGAGHSVAPLPPSPGLSSPGDPPEHRSGTWLRPGAWSILCCSPRTWALGTPLQTQVGVGVGCSAGPAPLHCEGWERSRLPAPPTSHRLGALAVPMLARLIPGALPGMGA